MENKKHGGKRPNAGRKSKDEEEKVKTKLAPFEKDAMKSFGMSLKGGEKWAVELWFKYYYGLPKQQIEADVKQTMINWVEEKSYE